MKKVNPKFVPDPELTHDEMMELQEELAGKAIFEDRLGFNPEDLEDKVVAGVDQAFTEDKAVSAIILMKDGEVIEEVAGSSSLEVPYIPGLLAFREGSAIIDAIEKLEREPDIMIFDGSGRIHYREAGIATHIGVIYDKPAIGVAKKLLCGEPVSNVDKLSQGEKVEIRSSNRMELEDKLIGYAYQSRQYPDSKRINPLYVSPGHRVSADSAVEIVSKLCKGYKLPEPTRLADKKVSEFKQEL